MKLQYSTKENTTNFSLGLNWNVPYPVRTTRRTAAVEHVRTLPVVLFAPLLRENPLLDTSQTDASYHLKLMG